MIDEQRIASLEQQVDRLQKMLLQVMQGPFKQQKARLAELAPMLEEWQNGTGKFAAAAKETKRPRKALNWVDYNNVISELENPDSKGIRAVARSLELPESTVRKYSKMTPEEVQALEAEHIEQPDDNDGDE